RCLPRRSRHARGPTVPGANAGSRHALASATRGRFASRTFGNLEGGDSMPTPKKVQEVEALKAQLRQSPMGILTDYRGLTVSDLAALRRQLREAGGSYHV